MNPIHVVVGLAGLGWAVVGVVSALSGHTEIGALQLGLGGLAIYAAGLAMRP